MPHLAQINERLEAALDPGFRARAVHEYRTVRQLTEDRVDLQSARILDFGCGQGIAAASFALRHPDATVFGCDVESVPADSLDRQYREQTGFGRPENLTLLSSEPGTLPPEVCELDLIFAWSVFEHVGFAELIETMRLVRGRLKRNGVALVQINPLYFSPRGSHLYRYDAAAWAHLLQAGNSLKQKVMSFDLVERTKLREWRQFQTLNRATADDIREAAEAAGFTVLLDERLKTAEKPPARLLRTYQERVLLTEELRLLLV